MIFYGSDWRYLCPRKNIFLAARTSSAESLFVKQTVLYLVTAIPTDPVAR